ncbi:hypothetical protein ABZ319_36500 [Nocardia sp. NPDC005978]|uniref:hypothetical protein n=1 Tax=Nocardia sp. NPDC005978 TaxID=3156725 RepID=UPI0033A073F2
MSETSSVNGRNRRKAQRSEGPPPATDVTEQVDVTVSTAKTAAPAAAATVKIGKQSDPVADSDSATGAETAAPVAAEEAKAAGTVDLGKAEAPAAVAAEPAEPAAEAASEAAGEPGAKTPRNWPVTALAAAAAVAIIALVVSLAFWIPAYRDSGDADGLRADYAQTAKQAILNITTIKADSAAADIDRVLSVASGQLAAEYSSRKDAYADVVKTANVKATGEIIEVAIESTTDSSAQVLVAAKQTLTNAGSAEPQQRYYRFRVTVTRDGDHFTASQLEFVA